MFDPLAVISLQQDPPGRAQTDEPLGGIQDHAGKLRPEGHERGLDLCISINRLASYVARRLRRAHGASHAFVRSPLHQTSASHNTSAP